jgi:hypothetical protein
MLGVGLAVLAVLSGICCSFCIKVYITPYTIIQIFQTCKVAVRAHARVCHVEVCVCERTCMAWQGRSGCTGCIGASNRKFYRKSEGAVPSSSALILLVWRFVDVKH